MRKINILLIVTVLLGIIYYRIDKHLFYFGKNSLNIYHALPLGIVPDFRPAFEGGFALRDKDGFTIAADGNTYPVNGKTIKIKKVLKYGFDRENLIAIINDDYKESYCVKFEENRKDKSFLVALASVDCPQSNSGSYKWINIDGNENYINRLELCGNWLMFIMVFSILLLFYLIFRFIKRRT